MYHLSGDRKKSFKVDLELCGRKNALEIDKGASKTILNEATYGRLCDALGPVQKTKAVLSTYTGEKIPVLAKEIKSSHCVRWRTEPALSRVA